MKLKVPAFGAFFLAVCLNAGISDAQAPMPLSYHPGNIFVSGENVELKLPQSSGVRTWTIHDYDGRVVKQMRSAGGTTNFGQLPVGYYVADDGGTVGFSLGVVQRLASTAPRNSPVALDTGMEYIYNRPQDWTVVASIASLTGVGWVRDRLRWGDIEPQRGQFAPHPLEEQALQIIQNAGLQVLWTVPGSAPWSGADGPRRLPPDLRDVYDFFSNVTARWGDKIGAIEPANEIDVANTGSEIASYQKAAYLAIKAGNPNVLVCDQPWLAPEPNVIEDYRNNEVNSYFDVFSVHHYVPADKLDSMFGAYGRIEQGKPVWVSEFNLTVPWRDERTKDPSPADQREQADRVAKMFAITLSKGVDRAFYFILPNFAEGPTQFGVLRADYTPRPAYLAVAAVGRLLAGARTLGKLNNASARGDDQVYAFDALPDGQRREVLIAWAAAGNSQITAPGPYEMYDSIGRRLENAGPRINLQHSPVFIVLGQGSLAAMSRRGASVAAPQIALGSNSGNSVSPIVMQALFSANQQITGAPMTLFSQHATGTSLIRAQSGAPNSTQVYIYNFSRNTVQVQLQASVSNGWTATIDHNTLQVPAHGRVPVNVEVAPSRGGGPGNASVVLRARSSTVPAAVVSWMLSAR